jgi:2-isopropylmalate synthase
MAFDHRKYIPFRPVAKKDRRWPDQVIDKAPDWCAVDLRDGNQALVKPMSVEQKKRFFKLLVELGFKEIEVGFPSASQIDFDFCRALIEEDMVPDGVAIQVLVQAREELIKRTYEALEGAKKAVVHVYNSTSTVQREQVFRMDKAGIRGIAEQGAQWVKDYAAKYPDTEWIFQYSPESFTGTELDYAVEVVDAVNAIWEPHKGQRVIINLPATVEMATPNIFADSIEYVIDNMQHREHVRISLHTHNDRGCAVAAAELGTMAGADRIEGTLLGNGERTGNMDLVTMAMNLYSQGVDPELDLFRMKDIIATVEDITDIKTHPRHPYAGELVFTAFSGSHQDAIRKCLAQRKEGDKWEVAYLPIDPADLGRRYEEVVRINSQSGKGGVAHVLERDYGIAVPRWLQMEFSKVVQQEAETDGGELDTASIHSLFDRHYLNVPVGWRLQSYDLHRTDEGVQAFINIGDDEQKVVNLKGQGSGAVDALVNALKDYTGVAIKVEQFDEHAMSEGADAQAMACARVIVDGEAHSTVALAGDTTSAALQTILSAAGRAEARAEKRKAS